MKIPGLIKDLAELSPTSVELAIHSFKVYYKVSKQINKQVYNNVWQAFRVFFA